jgi:hypothetical protein
MTGAAVSGENQYKYSNFNDLNLKCFACETAPARPVNRVQGPSGQDAARSAAEGGAADGQA